MIEYDQIKLGNACFRKSDIVRDIKAELEAINKVIDMLPINKDDRTLSHEFTEDYLLLSAPFLASMLGFIYKVIMDNVRDYHNLLLRVNAIIDDENDEMVTLYEKVTSELNNIEIKQV